MLYVTDTGYGQPRELMNRNFTVTKHYREYIYIHVFKNIYLYRAIYIFRCQLLWSMNLELILENHAGSGQNHLSQTKPALIMQVSLTKAILVMQTLFYKY